MTSSPDNSAVPKSSAPTSLWQRLSRKVWTTYERPDWKDHVGPDWTDTILDAQVTNDFHAKQGRSTGRWVLQRDHHTLCVYLKRHYRLPWWRGLLATLFPESAWSPGMEEFRNLQWAQKHGILIPPVVAAGQAVGPRGTLQSVLVLEELTGKLALHQAIPLAQKNLSPRAFRLWKNGLIEEMARLSRILHDAHAFHKDLYLCHFYVDLDDCHHVPQGWRDRVHMIDFHRLAKHRFTWAWWRVKDLGGLLFSSINEGVTPRDRLHFWRCYAQENSGGWRYRILRELVRLKGLQYWKHNEKLKAEKSSRKAA